MAQKSILSFFSPPKAKSSDSKSTAVKSPSPKKSKNVSFEESPEENGEDVASTSAIKKSTDEGSSDECNSPQVAVTPKRKTARKQVPNPKKFLNSDKAKKKGMSKANDDKSEKIVNGVENVEKDKENMSAQKKSPSNKKAAVNGIENKEKDKENVSAKKKSPANKKSPVNKNETKAKKATKDTNKSTPKRVKKDDKKLDNDNEGTQSNKENVTTKESPVNKKETKIEKVTNSNKKGKKRVNKISSDEEEEEKMESSISENKEKEEKSTVKEEIKNIETPVKSRGNKRKIEDNEPTVSSDDDSNMNVASKRKRKRNVIIEDDSPVKQVAGIFKQAKENYSNMLDKFIMKPKVEDEADSTVLNDLVKKKQKDNKTKSPKKNDESKMEIDEESEIKENSERTNLKTDSKSVEEETDEKVSNEKQSPVSQSKTNASKNEKSDSNKSASGSYCPSKNNYHPVDDACWKKGEKVPYLALAKTFEEIEEISGRLKTIETLANFFRSVIVLSPEDLVYSVYLCLNRLAPEYHSIELGVGETLLMKAMAQATGRSVDKIKAEVASKGDLGLVAESSRANQRVMFGFPKLTILSVFTKFKEIAEMSGNAVMNKKISIMQGLFSACRECEAKYIIRSLGGKLRIGLAEQSVLTALGQAATLTPPNQEYPPKVINALRSMHEKDAKALMESQILILKTTYCECPNYDVIIPILLKEGIAELPNQCHLTPGVPLKPMLAHPANSIEQVLNRLTKSEGKDEQKVIEFTCEFKYDGERAQIHRLEDGSVKIYSRNQEDNTSKYPDVIERFSNSLAEDTKSCILDSEVVAWDVEAQQIRPFQVLSTRKRKDAAQSEIKVQVCVIAFDLLYLNGESLVKKSLFERRELLHKSFKEVPNEFAFVKAMDGTDAEVMDKFLKESVEGNCEGLMVKALKVDATYEIAKRSHNWLKLKKDYMGGTADSFDLVVIGGWFGKGKRTGNYGGFLLACYDEETEEYQTICKIGTGFKDSDLKVHSDFFNEHKIPRPKPDYRYDSSLQPDQWFDNVQIWEVRCADLSISPVHKAASGIVDPEKGISLRFPRFIRIRDDKKLEGVTTAAEVADRYNCQKQIQNQNPKDSKPDIEDFY